ncbi:MAG: hypothetical protein GY931_18605 [Maribacter sp.]|nr:hypothetical protein [Maribacter sp.]
MDEPVCIVIPSKTLQLLPPNHFIVFINVGIPQQRFFVRVYLLRIKQTPHKASRESSSSTCCHTTASATGTAPVALPTAAPDTVPSADLLATFFTGCVFIPDAEESFMRSSIFLMSVEWDFS